MQFINLGPPVKKKFTVYRCKSLSRVKRLNLTSLWCLARKPSGFTDIHRSLPWHSIKMMKLIARRFGDEAWSSVQDEEWPKPVLVCQRGSGFWLVYISEIRVFNLYYISKTTGSLMAQLTFNINPSNNRKMILFEYSGTITLSPLLKSPVSASQQYINGIFTLSVNPNPLCTSSQSLCFFCRVIKEELQEEQNQLHFKRKRQTNEKHGIPEEFGVSFTSRKVTEYVLLSVFRQKMSTLCVVARR